MKIKPNLLYISLFLVVVMFGACKTSKTENSKRPNILFAISDDQSFPYASAYGTGGIKTPAFDKVAESGILFTNAFVAAPQCSPSRAAILTGKNIWQLEEAGTHSSYFPDKFQVFTDLLEVSGYTLGYTGKPWGPGNWKDAGWTRNPVGPGFNKIRKDSVPANGINKNDYFENFKDFYSQKNKDKPFFFWYGGYEPHRAYEEGSGIKSGKELYSAMVPPFLTEVDLIKSDVLDYALEIEYFDRQLGKMMDFLKENGELENTIIVVTADNGMPFPSAKANLQEYGTHVPLAICWPEKIKGNRVVDDLVGMIDLAPTFLEIANASGIPEVSGKSLTKILFSEKEGYVDNERKYVFTGRERHTHARPDNLGYPARAVRTKDFLYVLNFKPERWPAGDPAPKEAYSPNADEKTKALIPGFHDVDNSPSKQFLIEKKEKWPQYFNLAYAKRPEEQLYDIKNDPGCINNLAENPEFLNVKTELNKVLIHQLEKQKDPRVSGKGDIFESYPRFAHMRNFPGFKESGKYNPEFLEGIEPINPN